MVGRRSLNRPAGPNRLGDGPAGTTLIVSSGSQRPLCAVAAIMAKSSPVFRHISSHLPHVDRNCRARTVREFDGPAYARRHMGASRYARRDTHRPGVHIALWRAPEAPHCRRRISFIRLSGSGNHGRCIGVPSPAAALSACGNCRHSPVRGRNYAAVGSASSTTTVKFPA